MGALIAERYRIVRSLGDGSSARVFLVRDERRGGERVALKMHATAEPRRFRHEFALLSTLDHPGLARAYEFGRGREGYFFTAEAVDGDPADEYLARRRDPDVALRVFAGVLDALDYLHRQGIAHGDLRAPNVLCSDRSTKLIDFGLSASGTALDDLRRLGRLIRPFAGDDPTLRELAERLASDVPGRRFVDAATALAFLGRAPSAAGRFVGREAELKRIRESRASFVHGAERSGKTALLERARVDAQLAGSVAALGRPGFGPFAAVRDALEQLEFAGVDPGVLDRRYADGQSLRIAVTGELMEAARRQPLFLAFDDLHVVDPDSRALALHFAEMLPLGDGVRARVALAWRDGAPIQPPAGAHLPLGPVDVAEAVQAWLGGPPSAELVRDLAKATEGNPALLRDLLSDRARFVQREGAWHAKESLELPPGPGFDKLSLEGRRIVAALAATPYPLDRATIRRAVPSPTLDEDLERLIRLGWLRPVEERWGIASPMRRRAVPPAEIERWHLAVGDAIDSAGGRASIRQLEAMAHHFLRAPRQAARARKYARRAAERLGRRHAYARAAELYESAAGVAETEERLDLLELARQAWEAASDFPRAVEVAERAVATSRVGATLLSLGRSLKSRGDLPEALQALREAAAQKGTRVEALAEIAQLHAFKREAKELKAVLDEFGTPREMSKEVEAQVLGAKAALAFLEKDATRGAGFLDRAIEAARATKNPKALWRAWHDGHWLRSFANPRYFDAETYLREAIRVAREAGLAFEVASSTLGLAALKDVRGKVHEARDAKVEVLHKALMSGQRVNAADGAHNACASELDLGDPDAALRYGTLCEEIAGSIKQHNVLARVRCWVAMAHAMAGDMRRAWAALESADKTRTQDYYAPHAHDRAEAFVLWEAGLDAGKALKKRVDEDLKINAPIDAAPIAVMAAQAGAIDLDTVDALLSALKAWPNPLAQARLHCARAFLLLRAGEREKAFEEVQRSCELAPRHKGLEAIDLLRLLLRAELAPGPDRGIEHATSAYHEARARRRLRLAEEAAERVGDLVLKAGNAQGAERWYGEAKRALADRRHAWFDGRERELDRRAQELDRKIEQARRAPATAGWLRRMVEIDHELMAETHDLDRLLRRIIDAAIELTGADRGFILIPGTRQTECEVRVSRNYDKTDVKAPDFAISTSIAKRTLTEGKLFVCADAQSDERLRDAESVREGRLHSVLAIPLMRATDRLGVIYLDNRHRTGVFEAVDLELVNMLRDRATLAMSNARLVEEAQNALRARDRVLKSAAALASGEARDAAPPAPRHPAFDGLVGRSPALLDAIRTLEKAAATDAPVLILGETGTGKELAARGVHDASPRGKKPFVAVNCAAIPAQVLESELFGHVRGAFTGADRDRGGLFQAADGGTLFLDEIGEMGAGLQAKLLRALESREVRRVGSTESSPVDCRIVAASNRDLGRLVTEQAFREDLFYRLRGFLVTMPPLRERREDLPVLVQHLLDRQKQKRRLDPRAAELLIDYGWPGNVRELIRVLEAVTALSEEVIPPDLVRKQLHLPSSVQGDSLDLWANVAATERAVVARALEVCPSILQAAKRLGVGRSQLYRMMERYGLHPKEEQSRT